MIDYRTLSAWRRNNNRGDYVSKDERFNVYSDRTALRRGGAWTLVDRVERRTQCMDSFEECRELAAVWAGHQSSLS